MSYVQVRVKRRILRAWSDDPSPLCCPLFPQMGGGGGGGGASRPPTPLATLAHGKSCQSALFCPSGSRRLLTCCYDDRLRVWPDVTSASQAATAPDVVVKHDMHTGRWVLPFRTAWTPAGDAFLCGSMRRQVKTRESPLFVCACLHVPLSYLLENLRERELRSASCQLSAYALTCRGPLVLAALLGACAADPPCPPGGSSCRWASSRRRPATPWPSTPRSFSPPSRRAWWRTRACLSWLPGRRPDASLS